MKLRRITPIALAAVVASAAASQGHAGGATQITACGQVVTTSAFLTQDLYCPSSPGVVVGADGITIDLNEFTLRGDGSVGRYGIADNGWDRVTIKNGVVRNFYYGVFANNGADTISISNVAVSGSANDGIFVTGASVSVKSSTASANAGAGIDVSGASAKIQSSTAFGNGDGINVFGASASVKSSIASGNSGYGIVVHDFALVQSSTASGNGIDGIFVLGDAAVIKNNRVEANGFAGGASDLDGLGIDATSYTTAPVGTNVGRGNDDPAECNPAYLC